MPWVPGATSAQLLTLPRCSVGVTDAARAAPTDTSATSAAATIAPRSTRKPTRRHRPPAARENDMKNPFRRAALRAATPKTPPAQPPRRVRHLTSNCRPPATRTVVHAEPAAVKDGERRPSAERQA